MTLPGPNQGLEALRDSPFWKLVRVPRFKSALPRVILFSSGYFLEREIESACNRLNWPIKKLALPGGQVGSTEFVASLLAAVAGFSPDFVLTVNHMGLDQQGALLDLLGRMALPLASWFVDNPRLILHDFPGQPSPWCLPFTWDKGSLDTLAAKGFAQAVHLPLATDTGLFRPGLAPGPKAWRARVSFVGDSMEAPVAGLRQRLQAFPDILAGVSGAARGFAVSSVREVLNYLRDQEPDLYRSWQALPADQARLDFEQLITWEATRQTRQDLVRSLLPFEPLVAGDEHWKKALGRAGWRWLPRLNYYRDLPSFYPASEVCFNTTSLQMKGALNQRVFDVPACGGFLLTDGQDQLPELFEPGREAVCYAGPEEAGDLLRHYLAHPGERDQISQAARVRILAEHDYTHRLSSMAQALRRRYA
jgi:spore maturation protein CgeB